MSRHNEFECRGCKLVVVVRGRFTTLPLSGRKVSQALRAVWLVCLIQFVRVTVEWTICKPPSGSLYVRRKKYTGARCLVPHRVHTFPPSLPLWFSSEEPLGEKRQEYHLRRTVERPPPQPLSLHHLIHFSCAN